MRASQINGKLNKMNACVCERWRFLLQITIHEPFILLRHCVVFGGAATAAAAAAATTAVSLQCYSSCQVAIAKLLLHNVSLVVVVVVSFIQLTVCYYQERNLFVCPNLSNQRTTTTNAFIYRWALSKELSSLVCVVKLIIYR